MRRTWVVVAVGVVVVAGAVGIGIWAAGGDDDPGVETAEADGAGETTEADEAGQAGESGGPVIASAAGPPGTELGDGFTVVEGTVLIGDPIPAGVVALLGNEPVVDEGWTASLLVDGAEPRAIVDAYLAQAEAVGMAPIGSACGLDVEDLVCSGGARTADISDPRSLSVRTVRGPRGDIVSDHVVLRYATTELDWEHGVGIAFADDVPPDLAPVTEWPPLPGVGEPIGTAAEVHADIRVLEGSRLAGPVHLNLDDATGGIVAVLEVTGDPDDVLTAYLDAMARYPEDVTQREERTIGDATVTQAHYSEAGGDYIDLTVVERPGRPVWLQIHGGHD